MNKLLLLFFSIFIIDITLIAQSTSVKELDRAFNKETKHKLSRLVSGTNQDGFAVFFFKADKKIFSVAKRSSYSSNRRFDSAIIYHFVYINDTLLKVIYYRYDKATKQSGMIDAYYSNDKVIAIKKDGFVELPPLEHLKAKSEELKLMARELMSKAGK